MSTSQKRVGFFFPFKVKAAAPSMVTMGGGNAKIYLLGITYFKLRVELLSIARVYLLSWRQEPMNTASLWLLPPCQRGFQCLDMLEWIKWNFYHENSSIHFSSAFLYIHAWEEEWSCFLRDSKETVLMKKTEREQKRQKFLKSFLKTLCNERQGVIVSSSLKP